MKNYKLVIWISLLVVVGLALVTGCGASPSKVAESDKVKKGGTLNFGINRMVTNLNPVISTTGMNALTRGLTYESLLTMDKNHNEIRPALAKS